MATKEGPKNFQMAPRARFRILLLVFFALIKVGLCLAVYMFFEDVVEILNVVDESLRAYRVAVEKTLNNQAPGD